MTYLSANSHQYPDGLGPSTLPREVNGSPDCRYQDAIKNPDHGTRGVTDHVTRDVEPMLFNIKQHLFNVSSLLGQICNMP